MRLLVLNPNTSQFVTDRVVETARAAAGPECRVTGVTGRRGPPIVGTRSECVMAAAEALDLAAEHAGDADGILLAISFDTGLDALREMLPIPVVGMSEAGMLAAMTLARRFSLLTFGNRAVPIYEELVAHYGWTGRSAGVLSLPPLTEAQLRDTSLVLPDLAAAITTAAQDRGTEAGHFQEAGIPTFICGPGCIDQAHKADEFLTHTQIAQCEAFMWKLLEKVSAQVR